MAQILSSIKIEKDKLFKDVVYWENIPKFSVVSGVNGSGKTKLLNKIKEYLNQNGKGKYFFYFPCDYKIDSLLSAVLDDSTFTREEDRLINTLLSWRKNWAHKPAQRKELEDGKAEFIDIAIDLEKRYGKKLQDFSDVEIRGIVGEVPVEYYQENVSNIKISQSFFRYKNKEKSLKARLFDFEDSVVERKKTLEKELKKIFGTSQAPWDLINEKFYEYNFKHQINKPTDEGSYMPKFITSDGDEINFSELSSGEKMIVQLILWSYNENNIGNKGKLIMMDEFDAHLNPSMAEVFIKIIKEILIERFGMQVIMTTHSPSTIVYCDEKELFWMEDFRIIEKSKKEIISDLSCGLMLLEDAKDAISVIINKKSDKFLFVEGASDKIYLEKAIKVLKFDSLSKINIVPCHGADKINTIIDFYKHEVKNFENKNALILVDNDAKGRGIKNENIGIVLTKIKIEESLLAMLKESKSFDHPIEFLLPFELLEIGGIIKRKTSVRGILKYEDDNNIASDRWKMEESQKILTYELKHKNDKNSNDMVAKKKFAESVEENKENFENFLPLLEEVRSCFFSV